MSDKIKLVEENERKDFTKKISDEHKKCANEIRNLLTLQNDMSLLLQTQQEDVISLTDNIYRTDTYVAKAHADVKKSHKLYWKSVGIALGGTLGAGIAGPVGFLAGIKSVSSLILLTTGGGVIGGLSGKNMFKNI